MSLEDGAEMEMENEDRNHVMDNHLGEEFTILNGWGFADVGFLIHIMQTCIGSSRERRV